MENEGRAAGEARDAVTALNKSTLPRVLALLPADQAQTLRRSYFQKAYPQVFRDERSAEPHLKAALTLPSLNSDQRSAVQEISMEFHSQYEALCDQMVELEANAPDLERAIGGRGGREGGDWQQIQEQMRNREKIEFERNDLNDKTLSRLRAALNEDQIRQLGGLQLPE
jgi:hypothetical protein